MKKLLVFSADWCAPCAQLKPLIDEITQFEVVRYNVENDIDKVHEYGVKQIPMVFVLDDDGSLMAQRHGGMNRSQLQQFLAPYVRI